MPTKRSAGVPPKAMTRLIEHMGGIKNMTPEKLGALTDPKGIELRMKAMGAYSTEMKVKNKEEHDRYKGCNNDFERRKQMCQYAVDPSTGASEIHNETAKVNDQLTRVIKGWFTIKQLSAADKYNCSESEAKQIADQLPDDCQRDSPKPHLRALNLKEYYDIFEVVVAEHGTKDRNSVRTVASLNEDEVQEVSDLLKIIQIALNIQTQNSLKTS